MRLIGTKSFPYANRRVRADEEFEASASDAKVLVLLGNARYADGEPPAPVRRKRRYRRRDQQAEQIES